jgi:hypothetical protein
VVEVALRVSFSGFFQSQSSLSAVSANHIIFRFPLKPGQTEKSRRTADPAFFRLALPEGP